MKTADLLVEIGTEELPPKALRSLMQAFADNLADAVGGARLAHGDVHAYASPRRLAVLIENLAAGQDDRKAVQKGPPVNVAFDDDGSPKPAALAFAKKCGVGVNELERKQSAKGEWLAYETVEKGHSTAELIGELVEKALADVPIPRRMRWGNGDAEFVRPVHWIVLLHGKNVIDTSIMGIATGNETRGHRFHGKDVLTVKDPADYLQLLERDGHVVADFWQRRKLVEDGIAAVAAEAGGQVLADGDLVDEVTALVEWPVPLLGSFDESFLELPREAVISTLTSHQRYFPIVDDEGRLLPKFVTVANLESRDPDKVREGNERVIRPRLADAAFFFDGDRKTTLAARRDALRDVVYQRGLGSLHDKAARTAALVGTIGAMLDVPAAQAERAAMLAKCDLLTGMVGEFPELQGIMGRYYAMADGEPQQVADAIGEHYRPRFAGDELPTTIDGQVLSVADKLDTLAGIFAIGKKPSGNRDPFGLRRAALGIIRVSVECRLDFDLQDAIAEAVDAQPKGEPDAAELAADIYTFISDRLRRYFLDRDSRLATETFDAVLARQPGSLVDFDNRLHAVQGFLALDEAQSLAAANKRIANILKKAGVAERATVKKTLLKDDAEKALHTALGTSREAVLPLLEERRYAEALTRLAGLRTPVDKFFDDVMVMVDDTKLRGNRLALLGELRDLFLDVADISRLAIDGQ